MRRCCSFDLGMHPLVSLQVVSSCAGIFTLAANERPFGIVFLVHVCFKISSLFEPFFTLLATVWPFTVVHHLVSLQCASLGGGIVTLVAHKRFHPIVRVNMPGQIFGCCTGILTLVTSVRFQTTVHKQMSFHIVTSNAGVVTK